MLARTHRYTSVSPGRWPGRYSDRSTAVPSISLPQQWTSISSVRAFRLDRRPRRLASTNSIDHLERCSFIQSSQKFSATSHDGASIAIEEETVPQYDAHKFLPLRLGQTVLDRYFIVSKLGFGTCSTVWLVRDQSTEDFYVLKACTNDVMSNEIAVSDLVRSLDAEHPGIARLRVALDKFVVEGPAGQHQCLVFEPCGMSYTKFKNLLPGRVLGKTLFQQTLLFVLLAVDVLHQLGVVHTDLSPNNILLGVEDKTIFTEMMRCEAEQPSEQKATADRVVCRSRAMPVTHGEPMITDFGAAVIGEPNQKHNGDVMPNFYRAPEVILGMPWDDKVDLWSIGVMIWDLYEGKRLFYAVRDGHLDDEQHLAEMVALMGPPPKQFLERSTACQQYWDTEGNWIAKTPIPDQSFESREQRLSGEDKKLLLTFVRKLLRWLPEERPAAADLFDDPFLTQWHKQQLDQG